MYNKEFQMYAIKTNPVPSTSTNVCQKETSIFAFIILTFGKFIFIAQLVLLWLKGK